MRKQPTLKNNQNGLVSIVVTIIIMVIVTLIVLAFARIVRREQRQALDRQLSTQAFYAAETGINDAIKVLKAVPPGDPLPTKTDCAGGAPFPLPADTVLNSADGVAYTCLLVSNTQDSLEYTVGDTAAVAPVKLAASDTANIETITVSWQGKDNTVISGCSGKDLPKAGEWSSSCGPGVVRLDLVPIPASLNRVDLVATTMTAFLFPNKDSAGVDTTIVYDNNKGFSKQGQKYLVECKTPTPPAHQCSIKIDVPTGKQFQLRLQSLYNSSRVNIVAEDGAVPAARLKLVDAQASIDSTGKAKDVLRRIQVRVPLSGPSGASGSFAIQSADDLCKRFRVGVGFYERDDDCSGP